MMHSSILRKIPREALQASSVVLELLGDSVVGVHLFGSAVVGGLRPDSDVDLLVLVSERLDEATRRTLVPRLMKVSGRIGNKGSARPIELTVINLADVVPWRYPPRSELVYGEWLREEFERGRIPGAADDPDLAIVLMNARNDGIPLAGSPASELLDPVPMADIRRAIGESLPHLLESIQSDERNVLLTLARMWLTASVGEIAPKDVAAEWAMDRLPDEQASLLDEARRAYLGECNDCWEGRESRLAALVNAMKRLIEACPGIRI